MPIYGMGNGILQQTTCGSLLQELQRIWDEIGENDAERDKMLLQLEQECLNVYRRKVDQTSKYKAELHQELANAEAEVANLTAALGESPSLVLLDKAKGTLKEHIFVLKPTLENLRRRKQERVKELSEIQLQIVRICGEISGSVQLSDSVTVSQVDERDLTFKKLGELKAQLDDLQKEKTQRLQKVSNYVHQIHDLSSTLSLDFLDLVTEIHPSLGDTITTHPKSISNDTLGKLSGCVNSLRQEKQQRLQKLQVLGSTLVELWNLMDTPVEDQSRFAHVTSLISATADDVVGAGSVALGIIEQVEVEVDRLDLLKASKMKEIILKKQNELEEIYQNSHVDIDSESQRQILVHLIDSGGANLSEMLDGMDGKIRKAKEEACSRKEILEKVDKWTFACEEERWLDEYERDQNRYSAARGVHKNLKRAEKARTLVSKMPSLLEALMAKVKAWEKEKGKRFFYDKVPLLETLEEYTTIRQEKEEEKKKSREQKRLQEQLATEQEVLFGSKPSPIRPLSVKKLPGQNAGLNTPSTPMNRRLSSAPQRTGSSVKDIRKESGRMGWGPTPVNYVALAKEESLPSTISTAISP